MVRPRDTGFFECRASLEGETHLIVGGWKGGQVIDGRDLFEKLTGRQPRDDDRGRGEGEYLIYPEMLAAALREGERMLFRLIIKPVEK